MPINPQVIADQIGHCLTEAHFPELPNYYKGKVRENYDLPDGRRILISTDRQSAFDRTDFPCVPFKGQVLTQTAKFWFEQTKDICPNHVLAYPDPNVVVGRKLTMLPIEMVVRDYLTGSTDTSVWPLYSRGERVLYGNTLPDGLVKNSKLPETILTPTTKAEAGGGGHDLPITPAEIVAQGLLTQEEWDKLASLSLQLFARGRQIAASHGLILVDTKYEFGLDADGVITLADEIHTPDSSRYWLAHSYAERLAAGKEPESLDKEFLRLWVRANCEDPYDPATKIEIPATTLAEFAGKYIALFEQVTGQDFQLPELGQPVKERIRANLAPYFGS